MFRFNNPDALLVLLLVAAGVRVGAGDRDAPAPAGSRWPARAVGFAFLTKMLQALLVLPALGAGLPGRGAAGLRTRLAQLLAALGAMVVSAGWFVALVSCGPRTRGPTSAARPTTACWSWRWATTVWAASSAGRQATGGGRAPAAALAAPMFGGEAGITRLFARRLGPEISWLLPAALIALVAGLWFTRRDAAHRPDPRGLLLWGGWRW